MGAPRRPSEQQAHLELATEREGVEAPAAWRAMTPERGTKR